MKKIGTILCGSLTDGLTMRLSAQYPIEEVKTGKFVSIVGTQHRFFSLITNITLDVSHPDILLFPPSPKEETLIDVLQQRDVFAQVVIRPLLMLDSKKNRLPVKTIPMHFTPVYEASPQDIADIFGSEEEHSHYFHIGMPLDMHVPVCLDLDRFTERSNGIFGKTGTGKTFITRLILAGLVKKSEAVNLVFDMHSEYGFQARKEGKGKHFVKGLKTLFPNDVLIFSLDPQATRRRGCAPDFEVTLSAREIRLQDVACLQEELNLHPTALEAASLITAKYRDRWLEVLFEQEMRLKEFAYEIGAHPESVGALYRKLKRLERFPFLVKENSAAHSVIDHLLASLERGKHVIFEFGNHTSMLCYLLVANIITRRIHEAYVAKTEQFLASQDAADEPRRLMITIEEAHKFLNPLAAKQTIFGTIAREMRKYYVSLLVVDQRPSGIDEEVFSQIGTKLVALLNDEKDIQAVLTGTANATGLKTVLATLDSKKQIIIMGHAVPMPVVIKTREYDETFYQAVTQAEANFNKQSVINEIF